jgi:6-phosphogluconolactonase
MPRLIIAPTTTDAAVAAARLLADLLADRRRRAGVVHIALAGGSTPRHAYDALASLLDDWHGVHLWFGDERVVALDDPDANARMVQESLIARVDLPAEQIHVVPTALGATAACAAYDAELMRNLPGDELGTPVLDIAFLGLGEDGHTASLFPGAPGLSPTGSACVVVTDAPKLPRVRISLTMSVLAAARSRVVLATGAGKAAAVAAALEAPDPRIPASLLPAAHTTFVLDAAAAASIDEGDTRA